MSLSNLFKSKDSDTKTMVGAVIIFREGTSVEWAQMCLNKLHRSGGLSEQSTAHEYDARHGSPVFYIP